MKNILITGGYGFIGSNFINWLGAKQDCKIVMIDKRGYASNVHNLLPNTNVSVYEFDLSNGGAADLMNTTDDIFEKFKSFDAIFHFAAESHVDNSISGPIEFTQSNIVGTHKLLESWRKAGAKGRFIHVSTDEVYGHLTKYAMPFTEDTNLSPRSPYSASKASSDLIVKSYYETFGCDINITRCCNNFGPRQHTEKFIPKIITNIMQGKKVPVYGTGDNIREWIHVMDHVDAVWSVFTHGIPGEVYNIGTGNECSNIEIVELICSLMNKEPKEVIEFVADRKGHDFRYSIDSSKINTNLLWSPKYNDHYKNLQETIDWYKSKQTH